jgi:dTDP-4-amino-4,6-dideoxygalactose transaminase
MSYRIPFNRPHIIGREIDYIAQCLNNAKLSGDGHFTKQCQQLLRQKFAAEHVLLTTSCTAALEMAALMCDLKPQDEVILPSYTFTSTANAFALRGAKLTFVDVRSDTLNLDENLLEQAVTERTRVVVPVHYAGVACNMEAIGAFARRHGLRVVEDAAQGVNATYQGRYLGTLGDFGAYSFHETKNFVCGEGGALLSNRQRDVARAEIIREKGTNRSQFFRGEVDKYTWVDIGSSYLPSDILAAFLYAQLEQMDVITRRRRAIYEQYATALQPLAERGLLVLPTIPAECGSNYHMFYTLVADLRTRTELLEHLKGQGILATFHYVPLHTSTVGLSMGYRPGMLPVTESVSERLVRLPFYPDLGPADLRSIFTAIFSFFGVQAPELSAVASARLVLP